MTLPFEFEFADGIFCDDKNAVKSNIMKTLVNTAPLDGTPFIAPYVPCPLLLLDSAVEFAAINSDDIMVDLGCGDGRLLGASRRRGARVIGIELDPYLFAYTRDAYASDPLVSVLQCDMFTVNLDALNATVLVLYLLPAGLHKLRDMLTGWMERGSERRVVTIDYAIPDWTPTETRHIADTRDKLRPLYKYTL
jgi:SAM-dependent methyltransferase